MLVSNLLQEEFQEYAGKAKTLPETTMNENKLNLYGLCKQATVEPVNTSKYSIKHVFWFMFSHGMYMLFFQYDHLNLVIFLVYINIYNMSI